VRIAMISEHASPLAALGGADAGGQNTHVAELSAAMAELGHDVRVYTRRVVVTGGPGEEPAAAAVAESAGLGACAVLAGRTGLGELAALIGAARLLISGDTGVAHLATAFGTPSVILFGPMAPDRWGPPPAREQHRAIWHGSVSEPGDTPRPDPHPALLRITPDEVLHAAAAAVANAVAR
jgi:ADP-heptose:LPS heptosyltransferase